MSSLDINANTNGDILMQTKSSSSKLDKNNKRYNRIPGTKTSALSIGTDLNNMNEVNDLDTAMQLAKALGRSPKLLTKSMVPKRSTQALQGITSIEELIDIFKALPRDPHAYSMFMRSIGFEYQLDSNRGRDYAKHPIDSLRQGSGDCDDYSKINYFWAHLNGYQPQLTRTYNYKGHHVFIWYTDENDNIVVLDNKKCTTLENGESIQDYLSNYDIIDDIDVDINLPSNIQ